LGLALDEPKENDKTYDNDDLQFLVDTELMQNCGEITVDYHEDGYRSGFNISSKIPLAGSGESCGSSCSSGGCG
jgi:iron-sulfur cluster assembly protein